jgi:antagonist of KipI
LVLRVLPGAQAPWFSQSEFLGQTYSVAPASNRMGLRLAAKPLTHTLTEIVSEPVCPGTVQVTRDGQCIVLGVDGQTIGGYPKIAQVICADLDKLGQLKSGDQFQFRPVCLEEAERAFHRKQAELDEWLMRLAETARI